jgi:hypothetical protein
MVSIDANYHLFPPTEGELALAAASGFTITMLRFCVAFLLSVPVAMVFRSFPRTVSGRHAYAIVTGFCLLYYPFGNGILHFFVSSAVVYCLMLLAPRNCGNLTWGFAMSYLIMNHVKQASGLSWKVRLWCVLGGQWAVLGGRWAVLGGRPVSWRSRFTWLTRSTLVGLVLRRKATWISPGHKWWLL